VGQDELRYQTNFDTATLTNSFNGDGLADAEEVALYGYARRTLFVCAAPTNLVPVFPDITNAVAAWRSRDIIHIVSGNYAGEDVTLSGTNIVFEGDAFAVSRLTVAANASVTFAQSVGCGTLALTGQMTMATGVSLTSGSAQVEGSLSIATNGSFVVTDLGVGGSGSIAFSTNASLNAITAGVTMEGPVTLSATWGTAAAMPLTFDDNFDRYGVNTIVTNLGFRGWYASDGTVKVQTTARAGRAVALPDGTILSNRIVSTDRKIWTDYYLRPHLGGAPPQPPTNRASFVAYANAEGYMVVAVRDMGWQVCSNKLDPARSPATLLSSNGFTRITVFRNLDKGTFALFVAGDLVAQGLHSPNNTASYSAFGVDNRNQWFGSAYVDDVLIATNLPAGLTSDLDGDGIPDAAELQTYDLTTLWPPPPGVVYRFR
jgi:hypothetical protein